MPRGNDPTAGGDLYSQYGVYGNAEELIRGHRVHVDPALKAASLLQVDEEATAEVRENLDSEASKFDLREGETLLDAAVRGNALIGVVEDADGQVRKVVAAANDKWRAPKLTEAEEIDRANALEHDRVAAEVGRLRFESEERVRLAQAEADAHVSQELARIQSEASGRVDFAEMNADDAKGHVKGLSGDALAAARATEEAGKGRSSVLGAIDAREQELADEDQED